MQNTQHINPNNKNICIIGGYGAMGQMLKQFLLKLEYNITLFGENDWDTEAQNKLKDQDLIIISVPISVTKETISRCCQYIAKRTILTDITSVKTEPLKWMLEFHKGPTLGLHPIFGPTIQNPKDQVIIYCNGREPKAYNWFLKSLTSLQFTLKEMTAKSHDDAMTFIQGIEHFITFCVGGYLKQENADIEALLSMASPVYKMELNIIGRLFNQDPELYANIIASDATRLASIKRFSELVQKEADNLQSPQAKSQFVDTFNTIKHWMGDFTEKAYQESDKGLRISK